MTWRRAARLLSGPWVIGALMAVGILGLLLPLLVAPVTSDSRYHYLAAPARFGDSLFGVVPWTLNDISWRLEAGRFTPLGVLAQHVVYYLGMQLALATGIQLYLVEAVVKVLLLALVVLTFRALLGRLRDGRGRALSREAQDLGTLVFTVLLVAGVTTAHPARNGWVTFVVLCIGGCAVLLGLGAVTLWAVDVLRRTWPFPVRLLVAGGLTLAGGLLVISYELHWAAYPFAALLALGHGRGDVRLWQRAPGDGARWVAAGALSVGFWASFVATRLLIDRYAADVYPGLATDLEGPVLPTTALQLVNAVPGTGIPLVLHRTGGTALEPQLLRGAGWIFGACLALGTWLWIRRMDIRFSARTATSGEGAAAQDRTALLLLAVAAVGSALAAALILSVSEQSHDIVRVPGHTYRGTPWIWTCYATATVCLLLLARPGASTWRRPWRRTRVLVALPVAAALIAGAVVWPSNVAAVRHLRTDDTYALFEQIQHEVVTGSDTPAAREHRCRLDRAAREWATTPYRMGYVEIYPRAFEHQWGRPFCG